MPFKGETNLKITTVSASVRYSKPLPDGAWKAVELSAEATLDPQEGWIEAQASLYQDLGQQLKALWTSNGNVHASQGSAKAEASTAEHYCQEHQTEFKRYEKEGRVWYAHKAGQKWCKEK